MNEKVKKTLFIIATVLFVVSFCFLEVGMIIESIEAFFKGTTGGIRFFGDQTPYYGLEGVKRVLEGWGLGLLISYLPIMLYQLIYLFIILKEKYNSIKNNIINNKNEKKSETSFPTIIISWLAILLVIISIVSFSNILLSIVFKPKATSLLSILVIAEVTTLVYLAITEFIIIVAIILGIALIFLFNLNNWALMIIFLLSYFIFLTLTFVIIDILWKHRKQSN